MGLLRHVPIGSKLTGGRITATKRTVGRDAPASSLTVEHHGHADGVDIATINANTTPEDTFRNETSFLIQRYGPAIIGVDREFNANEVFLPSLF